MPQAALEVAEGAVRLVQALGDGLLGLLGEVLILGKEVVDMGG